VSVSLELSGEIGGLRPAEEVPLLVILDRPLLATHFWESQLGEAQRGGMTLTRCLTLMSFVLSKNVSNTTKLLFCCTLLAIPGEAHCKEECCWAYLVGISLNLP